MNKTRMWRVFVLFLTPVWIGFNNPPSSGVVVWIVCVRSRTEGRKRKLRRMEVERRQNWRGKRKTKEKKESVIIKIRIIKREEKKNGAKDKGGKLRWSES